MQLTYLAISRKPQEAVAWSAVQPSLSQASISAPCCTRNVTMSRLSSMHACRNIMKIMTTRDGIDVFYTFTNKLSYGLVTVHGNGTGTGTGIKLKVHYAMEMFTLVWNRKRDKNLLFPIVPVLFPVLVPVPFRCSVAKPLAATLVRQRDVTNISTDQLSPCSGERNNNRDALTRVV